MILRTWHGRTSLADAEKYKNFMRERAPLIINPFLA